MHVFFKQLLYSFAAVHACKQCKFHEKSEQHIQFEAPAGHLLVGSMMTCIYMP